ncbi:MAG: UTRA domain-containing protein [Pseudomonadales bacterium]|uniref:GntR family transcriptional regulator n=1 Tax=Oleiphilus messinensis TaxID=141451 RepID=A0A1Y0IBL0_9GAMM|nr:UTRA domain-containing protein [Oleiphilus messinensis]ARU57907.1 GntR family transcriptional regulator [Oleiphilus messinensis]MCG8610483.1 UTRA domain-containing protein [Pseudomonadales bacterium]
MEKNQKQYLLIRNQLASEIETDRYPVRSKIPSERELVERFGCTRITIREALMQLEADNLIYRQERRGWFVTPPKLVYRPEKKQSFLDMTSEQNRSGTTALISAETIVANRKTYQELQIPPGSMVHNIRRLRSLEGRPVLYESIYLPVDQFTDLLSQDLAGSLTRLLNTYYNESIHRETIRIASTTFNPSAAEALGVLPSRTGIRVNRLRMNENNIPVELDWEFWLSDALEFEVATFTA